jgi:hypothetical protein
MRSCQFVLKSYDAKKSNRLYVATPLPGVAGVVTEVTSSIASCQRQRTDVDSGPKPMPTVVNAFHSGNEFDTV